MNSNNIQEERQYILSEINRTISGLEIDLQTLKNRINNNKSMVTAFVPVASTVNLAVLVAKLQVLDTIDCELLGRINT